MIYRAVNSGFSLLVQGFLTNCPFVCFVTETLVHFRKFSILTIKHTILLLNNSHEYWSLIWLCFSECYGLNLANGPTGSCFEHLIPWCCRCFNMAEEPLLRSCLVDVGLWQQALGSSPHFHFCPSFPLQICQDGSHEPPSHASAAKSSAVLSLLLWTAAVAPREPLFFQVTSALYLVAVRKLGKVGGCICLWMLLYLIKVLLFLIKYVFYYRKLRR